MTEGRSSILLVDDNAELVQMLGRCFARAGFPVVTCGDGAQAIAELMARPFDVVITDIQMPQIDGLALLDWLQENRPRVRAIVMTAFGDPAIKNLSENKGAILYLEKPLDPNFLIDLIFSGGSRHRQNQYTGISKTSKGRG